MRFASAVTVAATLAAVTGAGAQEAPGLFGVDARLADYGLADVDLVQRGRISLVHDSAGDRIALQFLRATPLATPPPLPAEEPLVPPSGAAAEPGLRATWVWNTDELLRDERERGAFLAFVEEQKITRVFLYLPAAEGERPSAGYVPFDGSALAPLLAALHARGALTYALDGDPDYVREENHAGVVRTVRRVAEHNRARPAEERFHGVRYDVEPYLLPGFQGPARAEILDDYVRLLTDLADAAHAEGLRVGADVPFWFDAGDEETGEPFEAVLDGVRRPVLDHVMLAVDDIGVMAYRTSAQGPDGAIMHSAGEIERGRSVGVGIFVGIETTRLYDEELYTFRGEGRVGVPELQDAPWIVLQDLGGDRVRVWLADGERALRALETQVADPGTLRYWFAGQPVPLPGDRLSFYSLGADAMRDVTEQIVRQFADDPAFLGLAFHDYRGLSALLSR